MMGVLRSKRAQARIFEAIIVVTIIFPFAAFLHTYQASSPPDDPELQRVAACALISLDEQAILPKLLAEQDWARLKEAVKAALPSSISFTLTVWKIQWLTKPDGSQKAERQGWTGTAWSPSANPLKIECGKVTAVGKASVNYIANTLTEAGEAGRDAYLLTLTVARG